MIDICDTDDEDEFLDWLEYNHKSSESLINKNKLYEFILKGLTQRATERGLDKPSDLTHGCKFSSLFIKIMFGGTIQGNYYHQYNVINGEIIDICENSQDVRDLKNASYPVYQHDKNFFGNEEHIESLKSCLPRVLQWAQEYEQIPQNKIKIY